MTEDIYIVRVEIEDCFECYGAPNQSYIKEFPTLLQAMDFYHTNKKSDVCWYGDRVQRTHKPQHIVREVLPQQAKHGQVIGYQPQYLPF